MCVDPTDQRKNGMVNEYVKVPEGHVWIAGDNAAASRDSRDYGPVPIALVHSRVVAKVRNPNVVTWSGSHSMLVLPLGDTQNISR